MEVAIRLAHTRIHNDNIPQAPVSRSGNPIVEYLDYPLITRHQNSQKRIWGEKLTSENAMQLLYASKISETMRTRIAIVFTIIEILLQLRSASIPFGHRDML